MYIQGENFTTISGVWGDEYWKAINRSVTLSGSVYCFSDTLANNCITISGTISHCPACDTYIPPPVDVLEEHYGLFAALLFSTEFVGYRIRSIHRNIQKLAEYQHGSELHDVPDLLKAVLINQTKEFALSNLFDRYLEGRGWEKFDNQHSPSTWIVAYTYWEMLNILRSNRPNSLEEGPCWNVDIYDPRNQNFRLAFEEVAGWLDLSSTKDNPETILECKQLVKLALMVLGVRDMRVMLGIDTVESVLEKYNYTEGQYKMILSRKRQLLRLLLLKNGYEC